ncbi:MAG: hypothetical protein ACEY3L_09260 [Wolbachia sp.]
MSCQCVTLASSPFAQFHQKRCKGFRVYQLSALSGSQCQALG